MTSELKKFGDKEYCLLCNGRHLNELLYGVVYRRGKLIVHYFCLLLATNAQQRGKDDEGILGFLPQDILSAVQRAAKVVCTICKKKGATVECSKCSAVFHFPCGVSSGSLHHFFGRFKSFCPEHRIHQKIPKSVLDSVKSGNSLSCNICLENVSLETESIIWAPCCRKNGFFHRCCLQSMANSFGSYALKCPLCNDQKKFVQAIKSQGVYVPQQDASWEKEPDAFSELLARYQHCDASKCVCRWGRGYSLEEDPNWRIVLCSDCGSQGVHVKCLGVAIDSWKCSTCESVQSEGDSSQQLNSCGVDEVGSTEKPGRKRHYSSDYKLDKNVRKIVRKSCSVGNVQPMQQNSTALLSKNSAPTVERKNTAAKETTDCVMDIVIDNINNNNNNNNNISIFKRCHTRDAGGDEQRMKLACERIYNCQLPMFMTGEMSIRPSSCRGRHSVSRDSVKCNVTITQNLQPRRDHLTSPLEIITIQDDEEEEEEKMLLRSIKRRRMSKVCETFETSRIVAPVETAKTTVSSPAIIIDSDDDVDDGGKEEKEEKSQQTNLQQANNLDSCCQVGGYKQGGGGGESAAEEEEEEEQEMQQKIVRAAEIEEMQQNIIEEEEEVQPKIKEGDEKEEMQQKIICDGERNSEDEGKKVEEECMKESETQSMIIGADEGEITKTSQMQNQYQMKVNSKGDEEEGEVTICAQMHEEEEEEEEEDMEMKNDNKTGHLKATILAKYITELLKEKVALNTEQWPIAMWLIDREVKLVKLQALEVLKDVENQEPKALKDVNVQTYKVLNEDVDIQAPKGAKGAYKLMKEHVDPQSPKVLKGVDTDIQAPKALKDVDVQTYEVLEEDVEIQARKQAKEAYKVIKEDIDPQAPKVLKGAVDVDPQAPEVLKGVVDVDIQAPKGAKESYKVIKEDVDRQAPKVLKGDVDVDIQAPKGAKESYKVIKEDVDRQAPKVLKGVVDVDRQAPKSLKDVDVDINIQTPNNYVDIYWQKPITVISKVLVPVKEHPTFNFVGKLLGRKGNSLKRLQEMTKTKMRILGRGSMWDKFREEELRQSLDPRYSHLFDDLHVEISALAHPDEAHARIAQALSEIRKHLLPVL